MNAALLRKELRDQRFFALFGLALAAMDLLELVFSQPDRHPLGGSFPRLTESITWFAGLCAFAIGTGLLAREVDEGTLGFLDGLPVSRARVFVMKLAVALGVLMIYPTAHVVMHGVLHVMARGSLDHDVHAGLLGLKLALVALTILELLLAGMLLGFTRGLAWALFAVAVVVLKAASEKAPIVEAVLPASLVEFRLVGASPRIAWTTLGLHLGIAATLFAVAAWQFGRAGQSSRLTTLLQRPVISALVLLGTVVAGYFALDAIFTESPETRRRRAEDKLATTARFEPAPAGHASTLHYSFSYPAHNAARVQELLARADEGFARVEQLLGVDGGARIPVDLSGSSHNTEGTALLGTIRMKLDEENLLPVLAHETTHVFAQRASGGANDDVLDDMPVFNEGLARWVERHFDSDGGATPLDRFEGAVVSRRMLVTPGMLTDADRLYRAQGETLRYVLGAALIDALVRRYGASAPRRVLETIGASDFPRGLRGNELWTAAFQLSGFDLALVLDDYTRTLKKWESDYSSAIDELPRVRAVAWKTRGWAGVQVLPDKELPEGWYPAVRFRPTPDSPLRDYRYEWPQPNEIAWEPLTSVANGDICYQVGIGAAGVAIYEPWNCLPLDGAQEMKE